jgi:hypothetical protein
MAGLKAQHVCKKFFFIPEKNFYGNFKNVYNSFWSADKGRKYFPCSKVV